MKILAQFLIFMTVILIAIPCCAIEERIQVQADLSEEERSLDDCERDCSPFYICGNCIGFSFEALSFMSFETELIPLKHTQRYLVLELMVHPFPVWQPPKYS